MNILLDALPKTVEIAGIPWKIHSDFRTSVQFELLMQKSGLTDEDRLLQALALYFPTLPDDLPAAVEQMLWFYRCGEAAEEDSGTGAGPVYSFEHDADLIYAAFLAQYRIDLNADTLHWWKFRALLRGLHEDNEFVKIMGYRAVRITADMSKEQKAFYRRMKGLHKIPMAAEDRQKINDIEAALLDGADPARILGGGLTSKK